MNTILEIAAVLKRLKSAVIFTHIRPDGDTLGCASALHRALSFLGVRCETANEGEIPPRYLLLPCAEDIVRTPTLDAEAYICLDVSDTARLGALSETYLRGARKKITVNIDHHVSNARYAKYNYVRPCASNCENVAALIDALEVPFDRDICTALLAGIVTDSGSFSHDDVTGDTLRLAARCMDGGAQLDRITYELQSKRSKARAEFYAEIVSGVRYLLDDKLAVAVIPFGMTDRYGLKADATEGIVDFARSVDTVEVSACLYEIRRGQFQISLRSKSADVNEIARVFGGGGHPRASGCMLFGSVEEAIDRLTFTVKQYLDL